MSYPLQSTSKPSRSPVSLQLDHSDASSLLLHQSVNDTDNLLYDVPGSPPGSPTINGHLASPTSPTRPGRSRSPRRRTGRTTPIPGTRNRSITPSEPALSDLEAFSGYCRTWYYQHNEEDGRRMTQIMSSLPPSQRAQYSRIQASIRSSYHQHVVAQRTAEFLALLSTTQPGGSLLPHFRSDPDGPIARKGKILVVKLFLVRLTSPTERKERLGRFIRSWCTLGFPGTTPFFQGLWGIMRLQTLSEKLGGAGRCRIEWEIDDAVFMETAGKNFTLEAIDVLKGVIGFEEVPNIRPNSSVSLITGPYPSAPDIHARHQSQPLHSNATTSTPILTVNRARAPSDPFLDSVTTPLTRTTILESRKFPVESLEPLPISPRVFKTDLGVNEGSMRIWTTPDLSNPEYADLITLFPSFITRNALPRFPVTRPPDVEEGFDDWKPITVGTGSMWVGAKARSDGYKGRWWTRFILWWKRLFA